MGRPHLAIGSRTSSWMRFPSDRSRPRVRSRSRAVGPTRLAASCPSTRIALAHSRKSARSSRSGRAPRRGCGSHQTDRVRAFVRDRAPSGQLVSQRHALRRGSRSPIRGSRHVPRGTIAHQSIADDAARADRTSRSGRVPRRGCGSHQTDRVRAFVRDRAIKPTRLAAPCPSIRIALAHSRRVQSARFSRHKSLISRSSMEAARRPHLAIGARTSSLMVAVPIKPIASARSFATAPSGQLVSECSPSTRFALAHSRKSARSSRQSSTDLRWRPPAQTARDPRR
jgi:hypothetical protein